MQLSAHFASSGCDLVSQSGQTLLALLNTAALAMADQRDSLQLLLAALTYQCGAAHCVTWKYAERSVCSML
jgi:ribonuclease PH